MDSPDRDVVGDEAILLADDCVGHVTSGGYAHHAGRSMALGYVPPGCSADGAELTVEINGVQHPARVVCTPLYDPAGSRMRS